MGAIGPSSANIDRKAKKVDWLRQGWKEVDFSLIGM